MMANPDQLNDFGSWGLNQNDFDFSGAVFGTDDLSYADSLSEYPQTQQPTTTSAEALPPLNCNTTLQIPVSGNWSNTPTATNPSSVSTPVPFHDQSESGSDNSLSRQPSLESKRKSQELDPINPTKRLKVGRGRPNTAQNRISGNCLPCQLKTYKHACEPGEDPNGPCKACLKRANALSPAICRRARYQDVDIFRHGPTKGLAHTLRWLQKNSVSSQDPQKAKWKPITNLPVKRLRGQRPHTSHCTCPRDIQMRL